ncbi:MULTISPECIES: TIGR00266 family protein [Paenibacillus]|uniref:TIGR00266 family protein n=1 Tax=Paenibacillus chondroitinus TaxID=59842 RepID=A0ABU6DJ89_9BACL|nr:MULTISPECIES: TIGR00266 family protein [Paenibacillus]MCY9657597.1 TIGR00266 family protein [Paenibacillus anseongense]MEB4797420.1 TIGR00266 family protein [Paenibacillus chondroitinus]
MKHEILYKGAFPMLRVELEAGENIKAESGAMVSMSPNIELKGTVDGGIMKGLGRMLSGEKFFFQELTPTRGGGEVLLAPSVIGDIEAVELDGSYKLYVQKDGFLAGTSGIQVNTKMQNLMSGFMSGEGFFIVEISGRGTVFLSSYGAIHAINLAPGQEVVIDNGHLVAWPDYTQYTIEKAAKGWLSSITSGEGVVCRFRGEGVVLIQTRNPQSFGGWLKQFIPGAR